MATAWTPLTTGHVYHLSNIRRRMWAVGHPRYGKPTALVGICIGFMVGSRTWYGFEIRIGGKEQGVIFVPREDLQHMTIKDLGPYHAPE